MDEKISNNVNYGERVDTSLVRERRQIRHHSISHGDVITTNEKGDMLLSSVFHLNVGESDFIDPWNSYLSFQVTSTSPSFNGSYLSGSWMCLIRAVTISDSRGQELDRFTGANHLNNVLLRAMFGDDYFTTSAWTFSDVPEGGEVNTGFVQPASSIKVPGGPYTVLVPLACVSPFFRLKNLVPFAKGLQIRIDWENSTQGIFLQIVKTEDPSTNPPTELSTVMMTENLSSLDPPGYSLQNVHIVTDTFTLDNRLVEVLQNEWATRGLPIRYLSYSEVISATGVPLAQTELTLPVSQSFTRATKLLVQTRIVTPPKVTAFGGVQVFGQMLHPLYINQPYQYLSYHTIHNGQRNPHYPIQTQEQSYWHWLLAFNRHKNWLSNASSPKQQTQLKSDANTIAIVLDRAAYSFSNTDMYVSGVRVDGTAPLTLHLNLEETTIENFEYPYDIQDQMLNDSTRTVRGWMEYEKYVILHPAGNKVMN